MPHWCEWALHKATSSIGTAGTACPGTHVQVLSRDVPVEPDEVEALVNSPVEAAGGPLWTPAPPGSTSGSESEPQEPAVAVSAAVA